MNRLELMRDLLWLLFFLTPALFIYGLISFLGWIRGEIHGDQRK